MRSDFQPVIGLEVHAQLLTQTKIFCGCSTAFGAEPNANTCPVCLGMPGRAAGVERGSVVSSPCAPGSRSAARCSPTSVWSRKNYFYPDLPKGYQITQYDLPICEHGELAVDVADGERSACASAASTWRRTRARASTTQARWRVAGRLEPRAACR